MSTYIIADTHGCILTLRELLEVKLGVNKSDAIYFLGDYIDRGPSSAQLVEYLIDIKSKGYNLFPLRGNHEQMIIDAMYSVSGYNGWMLNAGELALRSYKELMSIFFEFPKDLPDKHLLFFTRLPYYYEIDEKYILVHAGLNYSKSNPLADSEAMLWNRPSPMPSDFLPGKKLIHGHTPTPLERIKAIIDDPTQRVIPLDAGCVYAGKIYGCGYLVALKLEDFTIEYVKNLDIKY